MSYCRWSSDDFRCDLYVYEAGDGVTIHVAAKRHDIRDADLPPPMELAAVDAAAWFARHQAVKTVIDRAPLVDIGLPHDGESFYGLSHIEAASRVRELIALGYRCDLSVADDLEAESTAPLTDTEAP